jgi:hypothetical protein
VKQYLGDSVYAEFDGYSIKLTTENGYGPSNTIWLEPNVVLALEAYRKRFFRGAHDCVCVPDPPIEAVIPGTPKKGRNSP